MRAMLTSRSEEALAQHARGSPCERHAHVPAELPEDRLTAGLSASGSSPGKAFKDAGGLWVFAVAHTIQEVIHQYTRHGWPQQPASCR